MKLKTEYFKVNKQESPGLDTIDVIEVFDNEGDLESIKQAVTNAKDRLFLAFSTVDVRDKDSEIIPIEDVIAQQPGLMERNAPISDNHTNKIVGQTLAWKVMPHPAVNRTGILQLNKIHGGEGNTPSEYLDSIWEETQMGERTGMSVGGHNRDTEFIMRDGLPTTKLVEFEQLETASVYSPANQLALNQAVSAVAKSKDISLDDVQDAISTIKQFSRKVNKGGQGSGRKPGSGSAIPEKFPSGKPISPELRRKLIAERERIGQNKTDVQKPEELDRIVQGILDNPDFKPLPGRTREESAHAIAQEMLNKSDDKAEPYGEEEEKNKLNKGEIKVETNKGNIKDVAMQKMAANEALTKEETSSMNDLLKRLGAEEEEEDKKKAEGEEEEKPDEEDKKKAEEEEKPKPEEPDEEDKKKAEGSEPAAGDIPGEADAPQPEAPKEDDPAEIEVVKSEISELTKSVGQLTKIVKTGLAARPRQVKKNAFSNPALGMLLGTKKISRNQVMKGWSDCVKADRNNKGY